MKIDSKVIYEGKALSLILEQANYPDGSSDTLEIIRHPGGAGAIALNIRNEICLIRQYRFAADGWIWEIPAGRIDHNEKPLETAKRELCEETGITADEWQSLGVIYPSPGICDERIFLYMASELTQGDTALEETEYIEIHWVPFDEAINLIKEGKIVDAKTLIALFYAQMHRKAT